MATTSIWPINGNISKVIRYVSNPDKTENNSFNNTDIQSLKDVMDYAVNPSKTEQQFLVSGINCEPSIARQQMIITKKRFDKLDGRTAYHAYQSFKPGETTPQIAHDIGVKFAQQLWGDRFQVVVATHVDKEHIHNHFVINSVSYMDGKKFHSTCESYFGQMRTLSDQLCEQHGLSVIRNPPKDGNATRSHFEWHDESDGKSTWRGLVKKDVDEVISRSSVWSQFLAGLKEKGYDVKTGVKHIAVRPPGKERFIRLRSLGEEYTEELIRKRLLDLNKQDCIKSDHSSHRLDESGIKRLNQIKSPIKRTNPLLYRSWPRYKPIGSYYHSLSQKKRKGYVPLYIRYMIQMGMLRPRSSSSRRTHFLLREDIRYLDRIMAEFHLIKSKRLDTYTDLLQYQQSTIERGVHLLAERKNLQYQIKRSTDDGQKDQLKMQSTSINHQLRQCRKELKMCDNIQTRSLTMTDKLSQIKQQQQPLTSQKKEENPHDQWR